MSTTRPEKRDQPAERIRAAVVARKYGVEQAQRFILPWRIHANEDHTKGLAECGCGIAPDDPQREKNL